MEKLSTDRRLKRDRCVPSPNFCRACLTEGSWLLALLKIRLIERPAGRSPMCATFEEARCLAEGSTHAEEDCSLGIGVTTPIAARHDRHRCGMLLQ